jgi:hypothetical protein
LFIELTSFETIRCSFLPGFQTPELNIARLFRPDYFSEAGDESVLLRPDTLIVVLDQVLDKPLTHEDTGDDPITRIR